MFDESNNITLMQIIVNSGSTGFVNCKRNSVIFETIVKTIETFLAICKFRKTPLSIFPKDMKNLLAQYLFMTRTDGESWKKIYHPLEEDEPVCEENAAKK